MHVHTATAFDSQGHAEDTILWHRYNYYVLGCALISDAEYDTLERVVRSQWSVSVCDTVGSSSEWDYPQYIREGRRPLEHERVDRDAAIVRRWMESM